MAGDLNVGALKGSININFGSVREAEKAIKSLQGTFSGYVKASNQAEAAAKKATKASQQQGRSATKLQADINSLNKRMEGMRQALRNTKASSDQVSKSWQSTSNAFAKAQSVISSTEASTDEVRQAFVQFDKVLVDNRQAINNNASSLKKMEAANKQAMAQTKRSVVNTKQREAALTRAAKAETQILIAQRNSAAATSAGSKALSEARRSLENYRATLSRTDVSVDELAASQGQLTRSIESARVKTTGLDGAAASMRSSIRGSRAAASQLGLQLQDVAVQAQMGTNWLIILGQQGSQLLGFLGPIGALSGAILAIGAALAYVFSSSQQAKKATKELDDALSNIGETVESTTDKFNGLSDEVLELAKRNEAAARIQLRATVAAAEEAAEKAKDALLSTANSAGAALGSAAFAIRELRKEGVSLAQAYAMANNVAEGGAITDPRQYQQVLQTLRQVKMATNQMVEEFKLAPPQAENLVNALSGITKNSTLKDF